ncbi:sensor domain-containing phosphodiesterase [Shewanella sp. D64]|uniref:sensor domain-containing diguanylate cyclase n=1 Tax=unclassified Shewanella TaxID=196818 RepID=UPI0022BA34EB|nr:MULTISPECIES: sensor domain-containing phosphodiesterase [unclassified Shewanella]MEC4728411.1 sensor domain-containing phosphodiesterase [Shewanella sp. D64]MEC4740178.1 sensor domain-containing phosphodiesterase [Shewanella sp. E94]WBJ96291.1 sensor domain-containing phosphodiesterase [Shewanella sp. MTB7]
MTESSIFHVGRRQSDQLRIKELSHYLSVIEESESSLKSLVTLLAQLCDVPFSGVSVIDSDKVWIKVHYGIDANYLAREGTFCTEAIESTLPLFVVENAAIDKRFMNNPLVVNDPKIRFYAAAPFHGEHGFAIGTLWVMDTKPIEITDKMALVIKCLSAYLAQALETQYKCEITQLSNKQCFQRQLQGLMNNKSEQFSVGTIHIQRLRHICKIYGPEFRNELIATIGRRFNSWAQSDQLVSHFGHGNFAFSLMGEQDQQSIENLLGLLVAPITLSGITTTVTVNAGIACTQANEASAAALIGMAELASVEKKSLGISNIHYQEKGCNNQLSIDIRACMHQDEVDNHLTAFYQPQINMENGSLIGFEALMRWNNSRYSNTPVWQVLDIVESMGMIPALDLVIFRKVCRDIASWKANGLTIPKVSTNLSRTTLHTASLLGDLQKALDEHGLDCTDVELEITEGGFSLDEKLFSTHISHLKEAGFKIAIDDFGTGMSNIATIKDIDCNLLKVDRQFVHGVSINPHIAALLRLIKGTADLLGIPLLVEGVETQNDLNWLTNENINLIQGWYFSKAIPPMLVPTLLQKIATMTDNSKTTYTNQAQHLRCILATITAGQTLR